jgi:hypothetical protein
MDTLETYQQRPLKKTQRSGKSMWPHEYNMHAQNTEQASRDKAWSGIVVAPFNREKA